jgi:hypothetical protein
VSTAHTCSCMHAYHLTTQYCRMPCLDYTLAAVSRLRSAPALRPPHREMSRIERETRGMVSSRALYLVVNLRMEKRWSLVCWHRIQMWEMRVALHALSINPFKHCLSAQSGNRGLLIVAVRRLRVQSGETRPHIDQ